MSLETQNPILSEAFSQRLLNEDFPVADIEEEIRRTGKRERTLRNWTNLPISVIREGLFDHTRDALQPRIEQAVFDLLEPWQTTDTDEDLPSLQVIQLTRALNLSPEKIISTLDRYPIRLGINGSTFVSAVEVPELPHGGLLDLTASRQYRVSPQRVLKQSMNETYRDRSRVVDKNRIDRGRINANLRTEAMRRARVRFIPENQIDESEYDVMGELETIVEKPRTKTVEEIFYSQPNGRELMTVFQSLKDVGFGKNWVLGGNEGMFAEALVRFSQGEPTDFVMWNCIGFTWFQSPRGALPTCDITTNLDAAIVQYFSGRVQSVLNTLARIGNPTLTILVPSNEALDESRWNYRQTRSEREEVLDIAVKGLTTAFQEIPLAQNAALKVTRWDNYLTQRNASVTAEMYSQKGEQKIKASKRYAHIVREAVQSGRSYFLENNVRNLTDETLIQGQIAYYSVYAGEGIAFTELMERGRNIIVINFEEMRVSQMASLGADGNLPIVTPITSEEMVDYYRHEARQIKKR